MRRTVHQWSLRVLALIALAGCGASPPAANETPAPPPTHAPGVESAGSPPADPGGGGSGESGTGALSTEELIDAGEVGLLPFLFRSNDSGDDLRGCDPGDPFSTCQ